MTTIVRSQDLELRPGGTVRFEGAPHGSLVSFFHVKNAPGKGASLHRHPYPETWFVHSGLARIVAGDEVIEAGPGDIVVVPGGVKHKFTNVGEGRLVIFCVHDTGTMVQDNLE